MKFDKSKLITQQAEITTASDVLVACCGNQTECARLLGIHRDSLRSWIRDGRNMIYLVKREGDQVEFTNVMKVGK